MKKTLLLSFIMLPLAVQAFDNYEAYSYGSDTPEIAFINAAKSYAIKIGYDSDDAKKIETLRPLSRSGSVQLPTGAEDDKFTAVLTLTAYDSYSDALNNQTPIDTKTYKVSFDRDMAKPIRATQSPAIMVNYSKGYFGDAGFSLKGNSLLNGFDATDITGDTSLVE